MKTVSEDNVLSVFGLSLNLKGCDILKKIQFSACSGDLLAVMGESGSGKTTLMNVIAGRQAFTSGKITLNGAPFGKQLRRRLGFVLQNDVFFSNLTLWETLYFTAMIRLPERLSREEKLRRLNEIVDILDIRKCLHTVMGDMFTRGLSGGEKKRASVACELLTDPDILLLDEPTSGLDSSTSLKLVRQLKDFAVTFNKTILVTIHQPSSQTYHLFDTLLLLTRGEVAYFGKAHGSPLDFLGRFGFKCDPLYNPADFLIEVMKESTEKLEEVIKANAESYQTFNAPLKKLEITEGLTNKAFVPDLSAIEKADPEAMHGSQVPLQSKRFSRDCAVDLDDLGLDIQESRDQRWPTGFATQFRMLTWRNYKQSKSRIFEFHDMVHFAILAAIAGVLFFQISKTAEVLRDRMGLIFFCITFWTFEPAIQAVLTFPSERGLITKERSAGAYRLSAYYLARTVSELPLQIVVPTLFYTFVYWMAGLNDVTVFFMTLPILLLSVISAQGFGLLIGALYSNMKVALLAGNTCILTWLLFSGFITQTIPWWLRWARYVSHIQYPLSAITIITFRGLEPVSCNNTAVSSMSKCSDDVNAFITADDILHHAGIVLPLHCYISTLAIVCIVVRIAVYISLRVRR
ncbi:uncharacterized protein LOC127834288 isoform X2 [Dreissena polymorpha]|uniref:uncharacterized protein LOC127834288 isoform X2 n=1 Tax=Dreissena polymorpha TaxID=45954 RepID=UPI002265559B|nr:uncharacterized protein LOC127834288 isoform X2 [Dreissena polymorpha]